MIQTASGQLEKFQDSVGIKFQLYNSLFLSLPFYGVDKTGILLSLFNSNCEDGFAGGKSPVEIIDTFFADRTADEKLDLLFRFVQYTERQVVLFDALEDAAFPEMHDLQGAGTLTQLENAVTQNDKLAELTEKLRNFSVRLVLTAHPTQFYPGSVLGIINDLEAAITTNNVTEINTLLQQLGRTPFFKKQKPTPFDEATSLIWYLEIVFYEAIGAIATDLKTSLADDDIKLNELVKMGFWSGGDRDGNPFVTSETTLQVAAALKRSILRSYHADVRRLKRRLTFANVESAIAELEKKLYSEAFQSAPAVLTKDEILRHLAEILTMLYSNHNGLFAHLVDDLINKVEIFGLYFAALDIRQEASEHGKVLQNIADTTGELPQNYSDLADREKIDALINIDTAPNVETDYEGLTKDTLLTVEAVKQIQRQNGREGCERYIISQCQSAAHVMEVYGLFLLGGWRRDELTVDIVPLFETITDLQNAPAIMRELYSMDAYREHLERRQSRQTIMLGFSDGTKDGGYLMANWSIYKAKDELTRLSREFDINVEFFDGRGGPPARGGGKTHKFYSSMGQNIADDAIQLTIQGQTVSSNFGTVASARYNIEQLLHAGIYNDVIAPKGATFTPREEELMTSLADHSFAAYDELKTHDNFVDYLSAVSPLRFYAETNIGSRPSKRGAGKLTLKDLRAIPFVGAWSQIKQNVPGFYGVGSALQKMEADIDEIASMYSTNGFFKALIDNSEMAMQKSYFPLTAFLEHHPTYGEVWRKIRDEYDLSRKYITRISGTNDLMSGLPVEQQSVRTRERIVLPLVTIQQYAITKIRESEERNENAEQRALFEKLVIRCSFGIINAGRNSA
ncbi:phosphoenolpyruvate carboxylase [soil metagenome]